jgi:hypothetical protein
MQNVVEGVRCSFAVAMHPELLFPNSKNLTLVVVLLRCPYACGRFSRQSVAYLSTRIGAHVVTLRN